VPKYRRALTYGTFDLFHGGHLRLFRRIKDLADELYVGVSTDGFNEIKGKRSITNFEERSAIVGALRCVNHVFEEFAWEQKEQDIVEYQADLLVMGADWKGKFDDLAPICDVVYLPRTQGVSSTNVKRKLLWLGAQNLAALQDALTLFGDLAQSLGGDTPDESEE
jgi:glycerol-3-phosphate cytidylyltransferase